MNKDQALRRWPKLTAHLICQSLGYFTPSGAANALAHHKAGKPFSCEYYSHMAQFQPGSKGLFDDEALLKVGREEIKRAFQLRKNHKGCMAEYQNAKALVDRAIQSGNEPTFASWF